MGWVLGMWYPMWYHIHLPYVYDTYERVIWVRDTYIESDDRVEFVTRIQVRMPIDFELHVYDTYGRVIWVRDTYIESDDRVEFVTRIQVRMPIDIELHVYDTYGRVISRMTCRYTSWHYLWHYSVIYIVDIWKIWTSHVVYSTQIYVTHKNASYHIRTSHITYGRVMSQYDMWIRHVTYDTAYLSRITHPICHVWHTLSHISSNIFRSCFRSSKRKLEGLFCHVSVKRDLSALAASFDFERTCAHTHNRRVSKLFDKIRLD